MTAVLPFISLLLQGVQSRFLGRMSEVCELKEEIRELRQLLLQCTPQTTNRTLYSWLSEWLELYKKGKVGQSYFDSLSYAFNLHIVGKFPDMPLSQVDGVSVQRFLNQMPDSRTKENVCLILRGAFEKAYTLRYIAFNPMCAVETAKHKRKQGQALTIEEQVFFKKRIENHPLRDYFLFLYYTGCRRSEALAVCKEDFDFPNRRLHIRGTKTKKSNRYIPLFDKVVELMYNILKDKEQSFRPFAYAKDRVTRAFKRCFPNHKLHDLRHTFATNAFVSGVSLKTVQEWLGHTDIQTTANIYTHFNETVSAGEAEKLNAVYALG